jgi:hypothetical protein
MRSALASNWPCAAVAGQRQVGRLGVEQPDDRRQAGQCRAVDAQVPHIVAAAAVGGHMAFGAELVSVDIQRHHRRRGQAFAAMQGCLTGNGRPRQQARLQLQRGIAT